MKLLNSKIIADSCCDLNKELKEKLKVDLVPLSIEIGDYNLRDDENLDTMELIQLMKDSHKAPKLPAHLQENIWKISREDNIFVVTLSSALSGSYNSAMLAKNDY